MACQSFIILDYRIPETPWQFLLSSPGQSLHPAPPFSPLITNLQAPIPPGAQPSCYSIAKEIIMHPSATVSVFRATINQANAQHSTDPRTESGKRRSSLNALRHGLTARTAVLPTEDAAAYEQHCRQFENEHQPATPTETQLVQELADTSWRLNRIPLLEAELLSLAPDGPQSPVPSPQPP